MNSVPKQILTPTISRNDSFVVSFEKKVAEIKNVFELEVLMKKLQFLGLNFDPFQNEHGDECEQILDQLELSEHLKNPYQATNILLRLLDITEERLNNLKQ